MPGTPIPQHIHDALINAVENAVAQARETLIGDMVEHRDPYVSGHIARTIVDAVYPMLMQSAFDAVIARIKVGVPLMVNKKYRDGALWVESQIEDLLIPAIHAGKDQ